ncbi:MAG: hypothetical protein JST93_29675 [Acidobacteria bacterium]|nr:hypothetical protein [Acidobacteriota bacterium]
MKQLVLALCTLQMAFGQTDGRVAVRSTGQFDPEGNALYSVYVASGQEDLEELTISAALPAGTRYLESVHKPQSGVYDGVKDNIVSWRVSRLERDTLLGPFVFRAKVDGTTAEVPETVQAAVAYQRPTAALVESEAPSGRLTVLAETGSITFDARGTLDASGANAPVFVGGTGVALFVPEGAVTQRVTVSLRRLPVDESKLPKTQPATWWCSQYVITTEPRVSFAKEVAIALPSRRALTPGLPVSVFLSDDGSNWNPASPEAKTATERGIGFGAAGQNVSVTCITQFGFTTCRVVSGGGFGFGGFGAFGYVEQDNIVSKLTGNALNTLGQPPSIIAILIGRK